MRVFIIQFRSEYADALCASYLNFCNAARLFIFIKAVLARVMHYCTKRDIRKNRLIIRRVVEFSHWYFSAIFIVNNF